jgi:hypothetical protein
VLASENLRPLWISLGAAAVLLVASGVTVGSPRTVHWASFLLAAAYAARLVVDGAPLDPGAPVFGAGLLLFSELGLWSLELRRAGSQEPALLVERASWTLALAFAGMALGALALTGASANVASSVALTAAGGAAATGAIWLIAALARERSGRG